MKDYISNCNMPTVSIIMPVYNAEQTLRRAVDSVISQTFTDWELLLIDDGSNDDSGKICDEYAQKDARIHALHQENQGVAMARQFGVEKAQGEYSIHIDADDWVEPMMLEELYRQAKEDNADVVIFDFYSNKGAKQSYCKQQPSSLVPMEILREMLQGRMFGALWHKLIRHSLYKKYDARFFQGINYCEDVLIWAQLLQHKELKIAYLPQAYYHYVVNPDSITHAYTRSTYEMRRLFQQKLTALLPRNGYEHEIANAAFSVFTEAFIYDVLTKEEIKEGLKEHRATILSLKSQKWKMGFFLLHFGFYSMAHQLIHF